jgi:hypothetical protein
MRHPDDMKAKEKIKIETSYVMTQSPFQAGSRPDFH